MKRWLDTSSDSKEGDLYFKRSLATFLLACTSEKRRFEFQSDWFRETHERLATKNGARGE
jgi:hypothetical protein